jgi:DNA mismatch endonuclease (patch repair protein)
MLACLAKKISFNLNYDFREQNLPEGLILKILRKLFMPDVFTRRKRSQVMSLIKGSGNKDTELKLLSIFRANRIWGWRRKYFLIGKPDFVFRRERVAVFVDGCFWHGCRWHCRMPKTRTDFWNPKIARNKARDRLVNRQLKANGWRVVRIWEHSLREPARVVSQIQTVLAPRSEKD